MVNPNHPRVKKSRKRRRKERKSGEIIPPTEFWTNEDGQNVSYGDSSYTDASLSPVSVSGVIAEAHQVLEGSIPSTMAMQIGGTPQVASASGTVSSTPNNQLPPLDTRLVEAIANRVEQKMMVQFNDLKVSLGGRIQQLEETVGRIDNENKRLKADIQALTVTGVDPENAVSIVNMVKGKVEEVLEEKNVLVKPPFDYDCTLACTGITEFPGENPQQIAETLIRDGLRLPHLTVVRAMRMPFNTKRGVPGIFKIELENLDAKKQALSVTGRLNGYTALGNRVMMRPSQTHEMRTMIGNWKTFLSETKMNNVMNVSKGGVLRPNQFRVNNQSIPQTNQTVQATPTYSYVVQQPTHGQMAVPNLAQMGQQQQQVIQQTQGSVIPQLLQAAQATASQIGQQRPPAPNYAPRVPPSNLANTNATQATPVVPPPVSAQLPVPQPQVVANVIQTMIGQG